MLFLFFITFTVPFIVLAIYDMWALTMMSSFTHQRSAASLTEREGPPPKHSLSHLPHSLSIIDMQLSVKKAARLSVDLFDEYFSWQTGHLTLHQKQCVVRERSLILATGNHMHICMHMYIQLQCCCCYYSVLNVLLIVYLHWFPPGLCVCHLWFWLQPTEKYIT